MEILEGLLHEHNSSRLVYMLEKALYGLKQSPQ
jgi:hypothetical protein